MERSNCYLGPGRGDHVLRTLHSKVKVKSAWGQVRSLNYSPHAGMGVRMQPAARSAIGTMVYSNAYGSL